VFNLLLKYADDTNLLVPENTDMLILQMNLDTLCTLFDTACVEFFNKIRFSGHCLHDILPPVSNQRYNMWQRAHRFVLPQCNNILHKKLFVNYCLFKTNVTVSLISIDAHTFDVFLINLPLTWKDL